LFTPTVAAQNSKEMVPMPSRGMTMSLVTFSVFFKKEENEVQCVSNKLLSQLSNASYLSP
jgi:hypothetical protein